MFGYVVPTHESNIFPLLVSRYERNYAETLMVACIPKGTIKYRSRKIILLLRFATNLWRSGNTLRLLKLSSNLGFSLFFFGD